MTQTHDTLITALMTHLGQRYPGETPQLVQTHISSILLIGEEAYKIKRPVHYAFVDFSTLEKRHFFCLEELRINRRTAPEIYLEVVPITGSANGPEMNGQGQVIDWALHMKRFPQECLLSSQARQGLLQEKKIDLLARHLADFHLGLPALPPSELASFRTMRSRVEDNISELATLLTAQKITVAYLASLSKEMLAWAKLCDDHSPARQQAGYFRECHGDLHLANIVQIKEQIIAFDALEFDSSLRCIDLINDIAFTFMDLLAFGQTELAWRLVSEYLERTGDYEGLYFLKGYAANRALVRAKVILLSSGQQSGALNYLNLAKQLLNTAQSPVTILVSGFSGSGKSTFAKMLATRLSGIRVRSDVVRKRLVSQGLVLPAAIYSKAATQQTYNRLVKIAEYGLRTNILVIIDATFTEPSYFEDFLALAQKSGSSLKLFECHADEKLMRERILSRKQKEEDPSDATPEILAGQIEQKVSALPENLQVQLVHNDGSLEELEKQALKIAQSMRHAKREP